MPPIDSQLIQLAIAIVGIAGTCIAIMRFVIGKLFEQQAVAAKNAATVLAESQRQQSEDTAKLQAAITAAQDRMTTALDNHFVENRRVLGEIAASMQASSGATIAALGA